MDITISKNLILRSGARYDLGTVQFEGAGSCGLINPELWYQNECYFVDCWARATLDRFRPDCDNVYILTAKAVTDLIDKCNRVADMFRRPGIRSSVILDEAKSLFALEEWCVKRYSPSSAGDTWSIEALRCDLAKVTGSITCLMGDISSPDVEYHLNT